jgi:hypothetical protein
MEDFERIYEQAIQLIILTGKHSSVRSDRICDDINTFRVLPWGGCSLAG